jgi:hypothetical protein
MAQLTVTIVVLGAFFFVMGYALAYTALQFACLLYDIFRQRR